MENQIILALMQLKGISRKTIWNDFVIQPSMDCTTDIIMESISKAKLSNKKVKNYSTVEISEAINKSDKIIENCNKNDIHIITYLDDKYPQRLKNINDPPTILYYKGNIDFLNELNAVAIIGTREPTVHGMKIARRLGQSFGKRNYMVVSGLAIGCDEGGHRGCLDVNGKTVAVMAGGLEKIYPAKNKDLADKILQTGGGLISEYPPYTAIFKNYFVERDRLQSGLSDGIMVVETGEKGGTLHTVQYALNYNRTVACYNHAGKYSKYLTNEKTFGNQKLIKENKAIPVSNDEELEEFRNIMESKNKDITNVKSVQSTIFDYGIGEKATNVRHI